MDNIVEKLKKVPAPVVIAIILGVMLLWKSNFSVWDVVADRVIDRMELKYSPYGPQPPATQPSHQVLPQ